MSPAAGEIKGRELWLRCPECGDSASNPDKAHFSINLDRWFYHCYRCGCGGRLQPKQVLAILSQVDGDLDLQYLTIEDRLDDEEFPEPLLGAGSSRPSRLDRHHLIDNSGITWDAFKMRHPKDNTLTGLHLRSGKNKMSLGDKGLGWPGEAPLISSPEDPLLIVEGPYDVLTDRSVCVFGLISQNMLRDLKGHFIELCPDGDIWTNSSLYWRFRETVQWLFKQGDPVLTAIVVLPNGIDPDQAKPGQAVVIPRTDIPRFLLAYEEQLP